MRTHSLLLIGALAFGLLAIVRHAQAQTPGTTTTKAIQWLSMEEAQAKTKRVPKPLFVDVYTQWCGPCKMLDRNTFSDPKVADYVNKHFYPVKFDAESGAAVTFKGQKLSNPDFDPARAGGRNGTHQLTYAIANVNGRIAYPTIVYLDEEMNVLAPVQGYMTPEQLEPVLVFFGEGHYKKQDYQAFMATFKSRR
ncbi:MAG: thioredoxin family protein [Flavobacteriales bacterium]|nr:thioredoxin family protein [Flavobacteriales bacterium]